MQVRSLGWEDPLEKEIATHSNILAWEISQTEEPVRLQSMGSQSWTRLSENTRARTHTHTHTLLFYYYCYSGYDCYHCSPTLPSELLISQSSKFLYLEGLHFQIRKLVLREVEKLEQDHTAHTKLKANFLHQHYVHGDIPEFVLICLHVLSSDHA